MTFKPIHIPGDLYFITGTVINWIPIFQDQDLLYIIIDSLKWHCQNQKMRLFAFVIMPDHLHWISIPRSPFTINENIQSFASYTAHEIVKTCRINQFSRYLNLFALHACPGKKHRIWLNFQAKNIFTGQFLFQKMEYIHNNPLKAEWFQSAKRSDYKYSSACYYDHGIEPVIQIDDIFPYIEYQHLPGRSGGA